ncbi:MAG: NAD(+) synthase [Burkholderiaceae bacterium]
MRSDPAFSPAALELDAARTVEGIRTAIRDGVARDLRRKGIVLGLSGGIDSSVVAALSVLAVGRERVLALLMPERESSEDSTQLGRMVAESLGIETVVEDISGTLEALDCYRRRDDAIRTVIPEYRSDFKCKLVLPALEDQAAYRISRIVAQAPDGRQFTARLTPQAYQGVVAATNFKQRVRKMLEYYHADRLNYAVAGTPNRLEYDQGFFVKNGDGCADLKPIAHLYKSQVYQIAEFLGIPDEIRRRPPTTDTWSLAQSQEEFYFSVPYDKMDLCLYGINHGIAAPDVARASGLTPEQVEHVYRDIGAKRNATRYLHRPPLLVEAVGDLPA